MGSFEDLKIIESTDKNVKKLVFTKEGDRGAVAEAVLYKYPTYEKRTVICCSTQSGCPVGCRFCGTGEFFIRNLTAKEIVEQVDECIKSSHSDEEFKTNDIERFQIMFMSMGEPMLNWPNLKVALHQLHKKYPKAALLISTVGPASSEKAWSELMQTAAEISTIGLQFSVHEAFEADRNKLIPMTNKMSLKQIKEAGERFLKETGRKPFFNYCVHDQNNRLDHVLALRETFNPSIWEATLSVICEADEGIAAANQRQRSLVEDFMSQMVLTGYSVRMFDPAGQDDIGGGCGQLWFVQDWAKNHPELTHKSHGAGKERIHAPK